SSSLKAEFIEFAQAEEQLRDGWKPEAIICEIQEGPLPRSLFSELVKYASKIPLFSFSVEMNSQSEERTTALGFIAHFDDSINLNELELHIKYGYRMLGSRPVSSSRIDQMIA